MPSTLVWTGTLPEDCDICHKLLSEEGKFIDGRTRHGPWAIMCPTCHRIHGTGLGTGKGQLYLIATRIKVEG